MLYLALLALVLPSAIAHIPAVSNAKTSLTLLYQNNLNGTDDSNHVGFLLLDPANKRDAAKACDAIGETLVSRTQINAHNADFASSLSYVAYAGRAHPVHKYHISDGIVALDANGKLDVLPLAPQGIKFPVLCTQSSQQSQPGDDLAATSNQVTIASTGNTYVGYRNQKSFRFLGIPYADTPKRFVHSVPYSRTRQTLNATVYAPKCPQYGDGAESCLFLNVQTPYLPKQGSKKGLRPVLFWIHGGGFVTGSAADAGTDGGNLASREDIVVVQIQYRLNTLGFLAIPGTDITGNYGIADQINALKWVIKNIASFGGDPNQITIGGDSAGAGSVRALLGSPPANGKFQGAIAMSNLGGGVTLGLESTYSTTYSSYLTVAESYALAGQNVFLAAGCNQTALSKQIACLKNVPASIISGLSSMARYVVQDGTYVNTQQLDVVNRNSGTAHVPAMFGVAHDDGSSIGATYPAIPVTSEIEGIQASLGISAAYAQSVIDSGLFPLYDTGNVTLDSFNVSARVATDSGFRCVDQATMFAAAKSHVFTASYYFEMDRAIGGYDPNLLGGAPVTPGYPDGNPNLPYFRFHSGATAPFIFGNVSPIRDSNDLKAAQLNSGYFAQFVKAGQPNPSERYLASRKYGETLHAVRQTGQWKHIKDENGPIRLLNYPSVSSGSKEERHGIEQYYPARIGDILFSRYRIVGKLGFGISSTVWLARDLHVQRYVAIKIFTSGNQATDEIAIYKHISQGDKSRIGYRYVRTALDSFQLMYGDGKHPCLVHEPLWDSITALLERRNQDRVSENLLRVVAQRLLLALDYLHTDRKLIHTDIKADNILHTIKDNSILSAFEQAEISQPSLRKKVADREIYVSRSLDFPNIVGEAVLCDFGNAVSRSDAPFPWSYSADIWNVGVMIWNIFEGRCLFNGQDPKRGRYTTRTHLTEMISILGPPPIELVKRGKRSAEWFDENGKWLEPDENDPERLPLLPSSSLNSVERNLNGKDKELFLKFIKSMLQWEPEKRKTARELLDDPWLSKLKTVPY
ncbi:hypothetical protein V493_01268 [Pseudogymnoascus sp. VKM F-4281 (FW-2241)]|nr:hypothetical protein V493_01268 [Pseudogymnoascus sp. VKM F-4281 (FW-2241)]